MLVWWRWSGYRWSGWNLKSTRALLRVSSVSRCHHTPWCSCYVRTVILLELVEGISRTVRKSRCVLVWSLRVKGHVFLSAPKEFMVSYERPELSTSLLSCFEWRNSCSEPEPRTQVLLSVSTALRASSLSSVSSFMFHLLRFSKSCTPTHACFLILWLWCSLAVVSLKQCFKKSFFVFPLSVFF